MDFCYFAFFYEKCYVWGEKKKKNFAVLPKQGELAQTHTHTSCSSTVFHHLGLPARVPRVTGKQWRHFGISRTHLSIQCAILASLAGVSIRTQESSDFVGSLIVAGRSRQQVQDPPTAAGSRRGGAGQDAPASSLLMKGVDVGNFTRFQQAAQGFWQFAEWSKCRPLSTQQRAATSAEKAAVRSGCFGVSVVRW